MLVVALGEPGVPVTCCAEAGVAARRVTAISVLQSLVLMTLVLQLGGSKHDLSTLRTQSARTRLESPIKAKRRLHRVRSGTRLRQSDLGPISLDRSRDRTEAGRTLSVEGRRGPAG